ncbi:T9SS type A sorting domain-containing protein [Aequorivita ciconiae]|nr:T9SS type A sorting domain-containing protein [Aequorivita sp. H23M31]
MFALATSFVFAQSATNAESILSQTSGAIGDGGVACGDQGAGTTGDNLYFRSYYLYDYGVRGIVQATGLEFFVSTATGSTALQVMVFDMEGFPGGFDATNMPVPLASASLTVTSAQVGTMVRADFDSPAIVDEDTTLVALVYETDGQTAQFYLGTAAAEDAPSYLASVACEINNPVPVAVIGFPDARHVINVIVDDVVAVGDNLAEMVSIFPNPTSSVLNINLPSNIEVLSSALVDVLGRTTGVVYSNGQMDVSGLSQGVYFLKLETTQGSLTQRIVKQ